MKRFCHIIILLLPLAFLACSEETLTEAPLQESESLFTTRTITFEGIAAGQSQTVEFHAPALWNAEIHSIGSWLKADLMHGEAGDVRITLSPRSDNFNIGMREAQLEILIDGYQPYVIHVSQKSAATGDIQVEGLTADGILQLQSDETGTEFRDTLWVSSSKRWTLAADDSDSGSLSFETDGEPRQGEQTRVRVIVKVPYSRFDGTSYQGRFYIRTDEGSAVPIGVRATAQVLVYDKEFSMGTEPECVSFNLQNTIQNGVFRTDCYVESNIRWTIGTLPEWVETSVTAGTLVNVQSNGQINPRRQHISFRVRDNALSRDGKSGSVTLTDTEGRVVKTLYLTFAGVGSSYIESTLFFPALDPMGNPFGFEAKASGIDPNNPADSWKQVRREFDIITATDYTSLANAPYHLILLRADNGIVRQQEAHWASLEYVGRKATDLQGLFCHTLAIRVSDRGDADDRSGLSVETSWRYAMALIVPRNVLFDDLWTADGQLRERYASRLVLIAQKNNVDADYHFGFQEVKDGGTLTVPAQGGTLNLTITPGSYTQCDILLEQQNQDGEWLPADGKTCQIDLTLDEHQQPKAVLFTLSPNKGETNPFTHQVVGQPRHIRVSIQAFLGDAEGSKTIFTFYIDQEIER